MLVAAVFTHVRDSVRSLTWAPGCTAVLLMVAVGIGASVPLNSAADALLVRPPECIVAYEEAPATSVRLAGISRQH